MLFVAAWFWYAVIAAVLYGAHQIFTRLAAQRIGDGLGSFIVEASAALSILIYLGVLWFSGHWNQKFSASGFNYSLLTGVCIGAGTVAFFFFFNAVDRSQPCQPFWRVARRSWQSQASCFSAKHPPGSDCSASRSRFSVCFCCAGELWPRTKQTTKIIIRLSFLAGFLAATTANGVVSCSLRALDNETPDCDRVLFCHCLGPCRAIRRTIF